MDMGAALQSPSEVSPEAQTEVKVEFSMSAGGSSFGESKRSDLCVVFGGSAMGQKRVPWRLFRRVFQRE